MPYAVHTNIIMTVFWIGADAWPHSTFRPNSEGTQAGEWLRDFVGVNRHPHAVPLACAADDDGSDGHARDGYQLSSWTLKWRPPRGVSVTVALMPAGSWPTYSARNRRSNCDSARVFSTWLMAPPMHARLPPPNGR
jgi:hypothetical protein